MASALARLIEALESSDDETAVTSVRQSRSLRAAAKLAVGMGWAASPSEGLNRALRDQLEAFAMRTALDEHFSAHPAARPSLADVAIALAEIEHSPLAEGPELIRRAAEEIADVKDDADAEDVLIWALSLQSHGLRGQARRKSGRTTLAGT